MSTRSQNNVVNTIAVPSKQVENTWLSLVRDSLLENSNFNIITLPHPAHEKPVKYGLDDANKKIYEIVTFKEPHRSWFIGETVISDGSIQIMTVVNPVYLVLPELRKQCSSRAMRLEDLQLGKILYFIDNLDNVSDLKGTSDTKAYKYNEEKTLSWLEERVRRTAKALKAKNIHVTSGAVSATYVTSNVGNETIDEEFYLKYAFGIVSEYLQKDLANKLEEKFNFKPDLVESVGNKKSKDNKRKSNEVSNGQNKKIKLEANENGQITNKRKSEEDCEENNKNIKLDKPFENSVFKKQKSPENNKKNIALKKAAKNTKLISNYFKK